MRFISPTAMIYRMITTLIISLVILIFSAIIHEVMHGYVAEKLGDPTARVMGRLTLNPLPHIDPFLSIILPVMMLILSGGTFAFGGAKPVPVNPMYFKDGKKDMAVVALAGPLTNLILAVIAAGIFKLNLPISGIDIVLIYIVLLNLLLTFINLIPIPPLDGSRVISAILPDDLNSFYMSIEPYGIYILAILIFFPLFGFNLWGYILQLILHVSAFLGVPASLLL